MLAFERTAHAKLIRAIITHPKIYRHVVDDGCPAREDFAPPMSPAVWYVLAKDGDEVLGLYALTPQNHVCYEVHTCLLPNAWGARAVEITRAAAEWYWRANPVCARIVTLVPESNRLALRLALKAGMAEYGRNPKSFLKYGRLEDAILLGISRPEEPEKKETCQQQ